MNFRSFLKSAKLFVMFLIIGNLFFLDYMAYINVKKQTVVPVETIVHDISNDSHKLTSMVTEVKNIEIALSVTPQIPQNQIIQSSAVKEYYVPFGSGNSQGTDWTDVPGLQAYIDTTLYSQIKQATFEVGGHTPTGNQIVSVRLYNTSDSHPVWNSDVTWNGGGSQFLVSNPIILDKGNKLYKVQMETQVGSLSYIDQAKVHIVLY